MPHALPFLLATGVEGRRAKPMASARNQAASKNPPAALHEKLGV
jgi:hypothetical protein